MVWCKKVILRARCKITGCFAMTSSSCCNLFIGFNYSLLRKISLFIVIVSLCICSLMYGHFNILSNSTGAFNQGSRLSFNKISTINFRYNTHENTNMTSSGVFPLNDYNDTDHRTVSQLRMMTQYGEASKFANRTVKVILRTGDFNWEEWIEGEQRFEINKCPVKECFLTSDYDKYRLTADALLISEIDSNAVKKFLPKPHHQIWIARHLESPMHNRIDPSSLRGLTNWTFTYRRSSTLSNQYFPQFVPTVSVDQRYLFINDPYFIRTPEPQRDGAFSSTINYARGKEKKVAWFVSNCNARNGRFKYAEELSRYIAVDIFGDCGKLKCPRSNDTCRKMGSDNYKFYLAFENSNCIDYITEKVGYQALLTNVIPIVMGARPEDYKSLLPPNSYIHVDDFRTPKDLAHYLHIVDKNETLYNSYFRWKATWSPVIDSWWCRLCFLLHYRDEVNYEHWYPDYTSWWNGACSAMWSEFGPWQTWRPAGFWNTLNTTSVHTPPPAV